MEFVILVLVLAGGFIVGDMYRSKKVYDLFGVKSSDDLKRLAAKTNPKLPA